MNTIVGGIVALLFSSIHLLFPFFEKRTARYRHIWVPWSGGVALGYVFFYMLPKLGDYTAEIIATEPDNWEFLQYRVYVIALLGLLVYLWLDPMSCRKSLRNEGLRKPPLGLGFAAYNVLVAYMIADLPRGGLTAYFLILIAIGPHLMAINHQLRNQQEVEFDRVLRWVFALAVVTGWSLGSTTELPKSVVRTTTTFLSGAILINVLRNELPERRSGRLTTFLFGILVFLVIALVFRSFPPIESN